LLRLPEAQFSMTIVPPAHNPGGTMIFPMQQFRLGIALAVCMAGRITLAESSAPDSQPDKSNRTFFNPTPTSDLRQLNPDRPTVTEGPFTVDAGHFQIESSFVEYTHDVSDGSRTDAFDVLPTNVRVGLLNNLEFDLVVDPYQNTVTTGRAPSNRQQGFGDVDLRAKLNFLGNDGGSIALGLLPFVKLPTGAAGISNHNVEAGLILPVGINLPAGFSIQAMAEFDLDRNAANTGYGVDSTESIVLQKSINDAVGVYVEAVGITPIRTGRTFQASADVGTSIAIGPNVAIDAGINIGISKAAPDFTVFTGITFRV
jgi:hypothetical protein